jgi:adenine deaminase
VGAGFVGGFGLQRGALASTIAHDAHNVVAVGVSDDDMLLAVRRIAEIGGGIVAAADGRVLAELPLPIAGLISDATLEEVIAGSRACHAAAHDLGTALDSPFQTMAFLALSVIPHLKLTDRGLVDVDAFELVDLWVR